MDSKSANKTKVRVLASRRRISSILNQSPTKLNASKGNIKRRINVLIKNNKTLAVALQNARCELSGKQKLLEKASDYFKTIMLARVKMTEMWSALNSILQDFDGTMEMLKCDNFKLSDITPPTFQSSGKFKNEMEKIAEAVESVTEESSFLFEQENKESDCGNSPDPPISRKSVSSSFCPVPMEILKNLGDKICSSSEPYIIQVLTENCIPANSSPGPIIPNSPCAKSRALVDPDNEKEMTSITGDSLIARNDISTPKLNLPNTIPMIDLQKNPRIAFCSLGEKDSSVVKKPFKVPGKDSDVPISLLKENDSSVKKSSKTPQSSLKVLNSKIPRFRSARNTAIKETSLSDEVSKRKSVRVCNKKNVSSPKQMNEIYCRRKTFVVKNSDPITAVALNEEDIIDMNSLEDEQSSEAFTSRKTFVVRNSSTLKKKRKSTNNKRKTFVKKCNRNNSPKSIKNRRGTFVLNDLNENCAEESKQPILTAYSREYDNFFKEELNKPCAMAVDEALLSASNDSFKITQNLQLSKKNCFIIDNPEMKDQKSNSEELFHEVNSEETLKNKLENSSALEKQCKSVNNKRKTFVKKYADNNSRKSIRNKRGTFVLTDINENCTEEEQLSANLANSECDDLVKEKLNQPCPRIADKALPSASNDCCEITENLQLLKKKNCIIDKPEMVNQESNSEELLSKVSSEESLKKNLANFSEIKDVDELICNKEDTRIVKFDEKNCKTDDLKSIILPEKPSVELPIQADTTTNEASTSVSKAKACKKEKNNCTAESIECNNQNLLLKNSSRRKACITLSQDKHITSKIWTSEKETAVLQTSSEEPRVYCSNNAKEESDRKSVFKESVLEMEVNNNEEGECSLKSKETNEKCKSSIKYATDGIEKSETNEKNLGSADLISDHDEIIILDNDEKKRKSRSRKEPSYKMFLESSYSDHESISEIENLENFEDEINAYTLAKPPVRGKVSFSKKNKYVFNKKADAKIKPQKYLDRSKNCRNLSNELISASAVNRNCEDNNLNTDTSQISENAGKSPLLHFANPKDGKIEMCPKRHVTFSDTQKIPKAVKIAENSVNRSTKTGNIKIHKHSIPENLDGQNDKNVNKTILPSNYSPVISLDKCLNNIECDFGNRKEKSDKINFSNETTLKIQNTDAEDVNNVKIQTYSVNDKTSKKKDSKRNRPNKKKKQIIESFVGKENVEDSQVNNKEKVKPNSRNNKAKTSEETKLGNINAIVVEAEIHPLPQTLNQLHTNIGNSTNYEVAVVLNDIFQSKNIDLLSVNNNEKRDRNCIITSPLSNNSSNILMHAKDESNAAKEVVNEDMTECRRNKRTRAVNYTEPTLRKKLRRW